MKIDGDNVGPFQIKTSLWLKTTNPDQPPPSIVLSNQNQNHQLQPLALRFRQPPPFKPIKAKARAFFIRKYLTFFYFMLFSIK
jgi:hypothetical protein